MQNSWTDEQREVVAEREIEVDQLKTRVLPKQSVGTTEISHTPPQPWSYRKTRLVLVAVLLFTNASNLCASAYRASTEPESVSLPFSADHVRVYESADGKTSYQVDVPLKELPYRMALKQRVPSQALWLPLFNLLLLGVLLHSYWSESQTRLDRRAE